MFSALSFTAPLILTALATLPLVWYLLRATPPSPKLMRFPAFIILRQLKTPEETPERTPWPLLLLRLLLTALIIIGLAGPVLNAPPQNLSSGPLLIVVDDTWPAAGAWQTRRNAVSEAAAEAAQSDRPVFLLTTARTRIDEDLEPLTGEEARRRAENLAPQPYLADREAAIEKLSAIDRFNSNGEMEIRWFSDGAASSGDQAFTDALRERGDVTVYSDRSTPKLALRPAGQSEDGPSFTVERLNAAGEWEGSLIAIARDGRELARSDVVIEDGEHQTVGTIDLPLALRNELASTRIENLSSAGAIQLADSRDRRALVGLVSEVAATPNNLLSGAHYIREALNPYTELLEGSIEDVLSSDVSVVILDDIGSLRAGELDALTAWVERGGVLIRFAGPVLAEAAQDRTPPLLPVDLRGGGRAFGGALTWETPQPLDDFSDDSPFAGLPAPKDVLIRRQVLAQPGGETTERTWARLADGTPLVTGARQGDGVIALFHITATPQWSDLPISGVFIEMLRRLTFLSTLGPESAEENADMRYAPIRLLDGFGRARRPADGDPSLTSRELLELPGPNRVPGLYGSPEAPFALNAVSNETIFEPLEVNGVLTLPYAAEPPVRLSSGLFILALLLLLADGVVTLMLAGKLRWRAMSAAMIACAILPLSPPDASAQQPLDAPIEKQTEETALKTRLAYVETGDAAMDRLSGQAMAALSRELYRRTALEPGPPARVDLETDDLSVYPFLYWPVVPGAEAPSEAALANVENFMRFGGLILFDTRDDERAVGAGSTPEGEALQRILSQLNIPPLKPADNDHVLMRSFYLLADLHGRMRNNPVWVAAETSGANDGVTPVIIGGRDWAGAWATDDIGREVRPMGRGAYGGRICTATPRECAYRAGINIVMVAFTGNYKSDQVHTPVLLERLGK